MAAGSLAKRVAALEAKVGDKTIQEQLREQAELIDRLFAQRFQELDERWNPRFVVIERALGTLQSDTGSLRSDVSILQTDVSSLQTDVGSLQKDMVIVKEGIRVLLERLPPR